MSNPQRQQHDAKNGNFNFSHTFVSISKVVVVVRDEVINVGGNDGEGGGEIFNLAYQISMSCKFFGSRNDYRFIVNRAAKKLQAG